MLDNDQVIKDIATLKSDVGHLVEAMEKQGKAAKEFRVCMLRQLRDEADNRAEEKVRAAVASVKFSILQWVAVLLATAAMSALVAFVSSPARASHSPCGPRENVVAFLTRAAGEHRIGPRLPGSTSRVELYVSPNTGSWSKVVNFMGGISCVVETGNIKDGPPKIEGSGA